MAIKSEIRPQKTALMPSIARFQGLGCYGFGSEYRGRPPVRPLPVRPPSARRPPAVCLPIACRLPADCLPIACRLPADCLPSRPASGGIPSLYPFLEHEHETVS